MGLFSPIWIYCSTRPSCSGQVSQRGGLILPDTATIYMAAMRIRIIRKRRSTVSAHTFFSKAETPDPLHHKSGTTFMALTTPASRILPCEKPLVWYSRAQAVVTESLLGQGTTAFILSYRLQRWTRVPAHRPADCKERRFWHLLRHSV